jgi:hypothetical protein
MKGEKMAHLHFVIALRHVHEKRFDRVSSDHSSPIALPAQQPYFHLSLPFVAKETSRYVPILHINHERGIIYESARFCCAHSTFPCLCPADKDGWKIINLAAPFENSSTLTAHRFRVNFETVECRPAICRNRRWQNPAIGSLAYRYLHIIRC